MPLTRCIHDHVAHAKFYGERRTQDGIRLSLDRPLAVALFAGEQVVVFAARAPEGVACDVDQDCVAGLRCGSADGTARRCRATFPGSGSSSGSSSGCAVIDTRGEGSRGQILLLLLLPLAVASVGVRKAWESFTRD